MKTGMHKRHPGRRNDLVQSKNSKIVPNMKTRSKNKRHPGRDGTDLMQI